MHNLSLLFTRLTQLDNGIIRYPSVQLLNHLVGVFP